MNLQRALALPMIEAFPIRVMLLNRQNRDGHDTSLIADLCGQTYLCRTGVVPVLHDNVCTVSYVSSKNGYSVTMGINGSMTLLGGTIMDEDLRLKKKLIQLLI